MKSLQFSTTAFGKIPNVARAEDAKIQKTAPPPSYDLMIGILFPIRFRALPRIIMIANTPTIFSGRIPVIAAYMMTNATIRYTGSAIPIILISLIAQFLMIFFLVLCIGLVIAYIIAKNIRKSLLGFEPGTFANMYLQREEILDNLDELILAVDRKKQLLYQNKTSETMEDANSFFANPALTNLIDEGFSTGKSLFGRMLEISGASLLVNLIPLPEHGKPEVVLLIMRDKTEIASLAQQLSGTNHVINALRANTHEYMNKLHVISGLLQIGSYDEAIAFISDVSSDIENGYQTVVRQIKNRTIAALILGKQNRSKELDIDFCLKKDSTLEEHNPYLSTKELVTIVGNLIENAFDATKYVDGIRQIELTIRSDEHGLMISADDTGHGMSEEQIDHIYKGQYTTKGEGHGIGLRLIPNLQNEIQIYRSSLHFIMEKMHLLISKNRMLILYC